MAAIAFPAHAQSLSALRTGPSLSDKYETIIEQPLRAGIRIFDIIPDQTDGFYIAITLAGVQEPELGLKAGERILGLAHIDASGAFQWYETLTPAYRSNTKAFLALGQSGDIYMAGVRRLPLDSAGSGWCYEQEYLVARFSGETGQQKWMRRSKPSTGGDDKFTHFKVIGDDPIFITSTSGGTASRQQSWLLDGETSMGNSVIVKRDPNNDLAFADGDFNSRTQDHLMVAALNGQNGDVKWARNLMTKHQWVNRSIPANANRKDPVNALNAKNVADIERVDLTVTSTHTHLLMKTAGMVHDGDLYPFAQTDKSVLLYSMDANGNPLSYRRFRTDQKPLVAAIAGSPDVVVRTEGVGGRITLSRYGLTGSRQWAQVLPAGTSCDTLRVQGSQALCMPRTLRSDKPDIVRVSILNGDILDPLTIGVLGQNNVPSRTVAFNNGLKSFAASHWEETSQTPQERCDIRVSGVSTSFLMTRKPEAPSLNLSDRIKQAPIAQRNDIDLFGRVSDSLQLSDRHMCPVYVDVGSGIAAQTKAYLITKDKAGRVTRGAALDKSSADAQGKILFSAPHGSLIEVEAGRSRSANAKATRAAPTRQHEVSCLVSF